MEKCDVTRSRSRTDMSDRHQRVTSHHQQLVVRHVAVERHSVKSIVVRDSTNNMFNLQLYSNVDVITSLLL